MTERQQNIAKLLRRRRIIRISAVVFVSILFLCVILDRAGAFGYPGDDWRKFNRKSYPVLRVISGDQLVIRDEVGSEQVVSLIGVDAPDLPDSHWANESLTYLQNRTRDRKITLRLDTTRSRDEQGNLLAYAYISDGDNLNMDAIKDGQAYADRRKTHSLKSQFESAETEARKKPRGLWKNLEFDQMPRWRQDWLKSMKR